MIYRRFQNMLSVVLRLCNRIRQVAARYIEHGARFVVPGSTCFKPVFSLLSFVPACLLTFLCLSLFIFIYFIFFMDALSPVCFTICLSVCLSVCLITTHTAIVLVFNCFHYSVRFWCSCCVCFYLSTGPPRGWGSRGKCPGAGGPKGAGVKRGESELAEMGRLKL